MSLSKAKSDLERGRTKKRTGHLFISKKSNAIESKYAGDAVCKCRECVRPINHECGRTKEENCEDDQTEVKVKVKVDVWSARF